jgi:hypothetical protein
LPFPPISSLFPFLLNTFTENHPRNITSFYSKRKRNFKGKRETEAYTGGSEKGGAILGAQSL